MSKNNSNYTKWLARSGILLALTLVIQFIGFPQFITGPLINMMLFFSASSLGWMTGSLIGGLTPWIAFIRGILPAPLGSMIPFIIAGNITLVTVYYFLRKKNGYFSIGLAAISKFFVLASAVNFLIDVPPPVAKMMQLPQLLTALAGGLLALFLRKAVNKLDLDFNL
ncbi:ECF transporter S component [Natroniella acetigena]|uniref:ECF transporter S component n=1 Tax=Natroniella acetigena TaxID=52004 RepID=UPI00200A2851|nr:ECF transporter S component [Natroniella acetigena]MCK8827230.1 ECF transporter S component [Natroniella acetigena]